MKSPFRSETFIPGRLFDLEMLGHRARYSNEAVIRSLCHNAYLGDDRALCRVLGRYKMFVDPKDVGLTSHLLLDGYWEMWLTEALADVIRPGMMVADIGANLGYFTLLMADLVGPEGRVHAFEPNPRMVDRLRQSISINGFDGRVDLHRQALSDAERDSRFVVNDEEPKNGYLVADGGEEQGPLLVTRRLDSYPELESLEVVKIDADTSEQRIWEGMSGLLDRGKSMTIFLEFSRVRYTDAAAFVDAITDRGFQLNWITYNHGIETTDKDAILAQDAFEDLMLVLRR